MYIGDTWNRVVSFSIVGVSSFSAAHCGHTCGSHAYTLTSPLIHNPIQIGDQAVRCGSGGVWARVPALPFPHASGQERDVPQHVCGMCTLGRGRVCVCVCVGGGGSPVNTLLHIGGCRLCVVPGGSRHDLLGIREIKQALRAGFTGSLSQNGPLPISWHTHTSQTSSLCSVLAYTNLRTTPPPPPPLPPKTHPHRCAAQRASRSSR